MTPDSNIAPGAPARTRLGARALAGGAQAMAIKARPHKEDR